MLSSQSPKIMLQRGSTNGRPLKHILFTSHCFLNIVHDSIDDKSKLIQMIAKFSQRYISQANDDIFT